MPTPFPHGIIAFPNIGGQARNFGMAANSHIYFVDGKLAANGDGTTRDGAFNNVSQALTVMTPYDVCYIIDKGPTGTFGAGTGVDPSPYIETATDLTIAYTQWGAALVGVANVVPMGPKTPQLKIRATNGNFILKVMAPFCTVENLAFNAAGGGTIRTGVWLYDDSYTLGAAFGSTVYNCYFRNCRGATVVGAANEGAGIYTRGGWGYRLINNVFDGCRQGIMVYSDVGTIQDLIISGAIFLNTSGANVDCDIFTQISGDNSLLVENIRMPHAIPSYAAGKARYIYMNASENGAMRAIYMGDASLTYGAAGTGVKAPATCKGAEIYTANALAAYA